MLEQVHEHIIGELRQSARTDTVFVITAIAFNLIVLGINSGVAGAAAGGGSLASDIVLGVFITLSFVVNGIAIAGLFFGSRTRSRLLKGLLAMYRDNGVDQYYDAALLANYSRRYWLFIGAIASLALTSIVVPLIIRTMV